MLDKLINEFLTLNSPEIKEIKENASILGGFLGLAKKLDSQEKIEKRFYEWSRSLYQATAMGESLENLENIFKEFFGLPVKPIGKGLSFKLRLSPSVKQLNGVKSEQVLFIKKLNVGEFYGALFPWQKNSEKIEIHLGFSAPGMTEGATAQLATLANKYLSKSAMTQMDLDVGGAIHGISLPSFLQMSEMEGSTFKLKISSKGRTGYLHVNEGKLVNAETGDLCGKDAAYQIISWEKVIIEIDSNEPCQEDEIQQPLMHVLMDSLKIKDEDASQAEEGTPSPPPPPESLNTVVTSSSVGIPIDGSKPTVGPFERVVPPSPMAFKKKRKALSFLLGLAIGLPVILAATLVGAHYFKKFQQEAAYQEMMAAVENEINPNTKEKYLIEFLDHHNPEKHLDEIEVKIREVRAQIETTDYEQVVLNIGSLSIDDFYETKALQIYNSFLSKYPDGPYSQEIRSSIGGIKDIIDDAYYQKLLANEKLDLGEKFDSYQNYLQRFPDGRHRNDVEKLLMEMGEQYYLFIKSQARVCEQKQIWDKCLVFCDNYMKAFEKSPRVGEVRRLKANLTDKQRFSEVMHRADQLGDDYIARQEMFQKHLSENPKTEAKTQILQSIDAIKSQVAIQKQWISLKNYADNSKYSIDARLTRVENYLDKNDKGTYSNLARDLYEDLLAEKVLHDRNQRSRAKKDQQNIKRQQTEAQQFAFAQRVAEVSKNFAVRIRTFNNRYQVDKSNETFKDTTTGHVWALLDSNQHFEYCLNYEDAQRYVAGLRWGGYSDWRLPTAAELAILYKNEPFFPANDAPWYWTSEAYVRGYHPVANIVTSKHERSFSRQSTNQNACGAVRAIRP